MKFARRVLVGVWLASLASAGHAAPTDYVIHGFTLEEGQDVPTSARFTYDPLVGFSAFSLTWRGTTFDLTASANQPYGFTKWGTHADSFALLSKTLPGVGADVHWGASNDCGTECFGPGFAFSTDRYDAAYVGIFNYYTDGIQDDDGPHSGRFTISAIPEADTLGMLGAGLATLAWLRRRGPSSKKGA